MGILEMQYIMDYLKHEMVRFIPFYLRVVILASYKSLIIINTIGATIEPGALAMETLISEIIENWSLQDIDQNAKLLFMVGVTIPPPN